MVVWLSLSHDQYNCCRFRTYLYLIIQCEIAKGLTPFVNFQIALFVSSNDATKPGWLLKFLRGISPAVIKEMQQNLAKVCSLLFVDLISIQSLLFDSSALHLAKYGWLTLKINFAQVLLDVRHPVDTSDLKIDYVENILYSN